MSSINDFYTKRLFCRQVKESDLCLITEWNNSAISNGMYLSAENDKVSENKYKFKHNVFWNNKNKTYIIEIKNGFIPIGMIKYWTKANNPLCALVTLKIAKPEARGKGYGTEVQKAMVRELFIKYKFESIEMYTDINNIAQQKCLKNLDFETVDIENYEDAGVLRQGYLFRLTRDKYEKSGVHIYYYE